MTQSARRLLTSYPARLLLAVVLIVGGILVVNRVILPATRPPTYSPPPITSAAKLVPGQIPQGIWLVGSDVQPGTYRSLGATPRTNLCWWGRLSDTSGTSAGIIAWGMVNAGEQVVVTVEPGDAAFKNTGCEPFVKID